MALINKLTAIGDAIRNKNGSTGKLTLEGMVTAINDLASVTINGVKQTGDIAFETGELTMITEATLPYNPYSSAAVLFNNEMHILSGDSDSDGDHRKKHYKFDGSAWKSVSTLPFYARSCNAVVCNGEIHILGSTSGEGKRHYKWNGSSWTSVSTLPFSHETGSAVVLNGEIHILGGKNSFTAHYKWNGSSWTSVSTLPYRFWTGKAVVFNDEIHIFGGYYSTTYHYKWNGSSWTSVSTLPREFILGSVVLYENMLYLIGGSYDENYQKTCYTYNGRSWTKLLDFTQSFYNTPALAHTDGVHVFFSTKEHYSIGQLYKKVG